MVDRLQGRSEVAAFLLALLVLRLVFLLGAIDPAKERVMDILSVAGVEWKQGPERPLYDREELYAATAAEAMRAGYDLPLRAYRFMPYGGGSLLVAILAVPIYALFGPYYLAFKLIALAVTLLAGWAWFVTARRWLGSRAANWFALLYLFGPPVLVRTALIAKGDHPEAMALLGVTAALATQAAFSASPRARLRWAAACGAIAGIGIWVTYSTVPALAAVALVAALKTRLRPRPAWVACAAGFTAGLIPWVITLASTPSALHIYGQSVFSTANVASAGARVALLVRRGLLASYDFGPPWLRIMTSWLWFAAVVIGAVRWIARGDRFPALAALAGSLVTIAAFVLRAPDPSSRYLLPAYPLFILMAAVFAGGVGSAANSPSKEGSLLKLPGWRPRLAAALVVMGLICQVSAIGSGRFVALQAPLAGVDWPLFGEIAGQKLTASGIKTLPANVRPFFWVGYGEQMFFTVDREDWRRAVAAADSSAASVIWEGIGIGWTFSRRLNEVPAFLPQLNESERAALLRGIGRYGEVVMAPLALIIDPAGVERYVAAFPREEQQPLRSALERSVATFSVQDVAADVWSKPAALRVLGDGGISRGAGWAVYRGGDSGGKPRVWSHPRGSWAAEIADRALSHGDDQPFWAGVGAALELELARLDSRWMSDPARGLRATARTIERWRKSIGDEPAGALYTAAGRAYSRASRTPGRGRPAVPAEWQQVVPQAFQADFAAGISANAEWD